MAVIFACFILLLVLPATCSMVPPSSPTSRVSQHSEPHISFVNNTSFILNDGHSDASVPQRWKGDVVSLKSRLRNASRLQTPLNAISRTGVCVPEDVGLYGRTIIAYECLYTQNGKTQTGDEWEAEQIAAASAKFSKKMKKPKKEKSAKKQGETEVEPYKRLIFPPPYNTTGMLLREGEPYLVLSTWLPGVKIEDILVAMDYGEADAYVPKRYTTDNLHDLEITEKIHKYYQAIEAVPRGFEQHEKSYNSTYNDLFNQMVENSDEMGHYSQYTKAKNRPPMLIINAPKNTIVKQFEFNIFGRKRDPNHPNRHNDSGIKADPIPDRIQRAYRPFSFVDLRDIQCNMKDGTLQTRVKLTHIPPPPEMRKIFQIRIGDGEVSPPRLFPLEQVHGWMYNWHHFEKYDLSFDISKFKIEDVENFNPEERDRMELPDDDQMTLRDVRKLMKEYDEYHKKHG
ncbi:uncharacterized protein BXIN_0188 [Babesia sp. Xinjiang]|uniref:uncharacterized protein n=1 Tax=Babesia sp. Xinjiang TaxID=462227 RepID=UPI000A232297|nr:uncharacterized protein BXIN_0188 [Babesia sp. Xinjiang]ORM39860.1 hypothetical protein BXIN_0188 [Babesia sp. Xinjiang]